MNTSQFSWRLQCGKSGLSKADIYEMVDDIASDFADCVVRSLQKEQNAEAAYVIELTVDGFDLTRIEEGGYRSR